MTVQDRFSAAFQGLTLSDVAVYGLFLAMVAWSLAKLLPPVGRGLSRFFHQHPIPHPGAPEMEALAKLVADLRQLVTDAAPLIRDLKEVVSDVKVLVPNKPAA